MTATDLRTAPRILRDHLHRHCATPCHVNECNDGCDQAARDLVCELRNAGVLAGRPPVYEPVMAELESSMHVARVLLRFLLDEVAPEGGEALITDPGERMRVCRALASQAAAALSSVFPSAAA